MIGTNHTKVERLVRLKELTNIIGYSSTSIWRRCKEGTFPCALKIGPRAVAWRFTEIEAWMNSRQIAR
jgi:prophage regulatory protein